MCVNGLRINMGFGPPFGLWPSSFSVLALDHGPRHFMLQNRPKTCKNEVPPNYWSFSHLHIYLGGTSFLQVFGLFWSMK